MRITDFFRFGFINLWRRKTRTVLTALSMAIGVMCIVVLVSVGIGYEQSYRESLEDMGSLTKIDVSVNAKAMQSGKSPILNDKAVGAFKNLAGVEAVTPVVQSTAYLKSGRYINMVHLYGIDLESAGAFLLDPTEGVMPGAGLRLKPELMVTDDVAAGFADPANDWEEALDESGNPLIDPLESPIKLTFDYSALTGSQKLDEDGRALRGGDFYRLNIRGICSSLNNNFSTSVFLDKERLEEWLEANSDFVGKKSEDQLALEKKVGTTYDLVWVKAETPEDVQPIAKAIQNAGFNTYSLNDVLETIRKQSRQIQGMLAAIGCVSLLVSAICVANTMMMSINERTREVGVLKVLGTSLSDIVKLFLSEALLVGITGGVFGLGLSYLMKAFLPSFFAEMNVRSVIPPWLAVTGIAFAGVVALLSAMFPAVKAMRISPNEAIRTE